MSNFQTQQTLIIKNLCTLSLRNIHILIFTCIIPRGAPFADGTPPLLLGGDGPPCGGPGGAPAAPGGGGAALFSGAGGGPAPVKGLSHEIDFKTQKETTMYGTDNSVTKNLSTVPDPDPRVFGPSRSGSISQRYGFGSFYH